ncbi:DUF945 domain-containing protein [Eubacteriales bacterium OttesenSCG-928-A19]|nr:DUF945 domain-containing protein [Eubacteriales bacterium OttesenSCG-928-A19]
MKTGRDLSPLLEELRRQSQAKRDYVVPQQRMRMSENAHHFWLMPDDDARHNVPLEMTHLFHRQMGAVLGIPSKYYDKMHETLPSLLAANVNAWFERGETKHTIRTMDSLGRAFLSDRYRRLDNLEIALTVLPLIAEMEGARVESCEVTDNRMYIKVVNTRLEAEVVPGDVVQAGIVISNSEVGLGSVSVMPLVYRLVCANGMILPDMGQRKNHVGRELDEMWEIYSDATMEAEDAAFLMKLSDTVRMAVKETQFAIIVDKLRAAHDAKITAPIPEIVELTAKQYGLNQTEGNDILRHLIEGGDLSLYGLANAVTRAANDAMDYDRASALEGLGGQMALMPRAQWMALNEVPQ